MPERFGNVPAHDPRKSRPEPHTTLQAIALSAMAAQHTITAQCPFAMPVPMMYLGSNMLPNRALPADRTLGEVHRDSEITNRAERARFDTPPPAPNAGVVARRAEYRAAAALDHQLVRNCSSRLASVAEPVLRRPRAAVNSVARGPRVFSTAS